MEMTKAVKADIPQLCVLLDHLFTQEADFTPNPELQARGLDAVISGPDMGEILIARKSGELPGTGEILGMVNLLYTVSTVLGARVGIIEDMVVAPSGRGMGVGSKILSYAIDFAKQNGCKRITLLTDHDNLGAHRFYQKHGFTPSKMVTFRLSLEDE
ncbi:MAG: GNAT family N-acetyltransferase [Halopseudomonas aestusnigri]